VRNKSGDLVFRVFTPLDVVCDRFRYDADHDWIITRRYVNRWDLAARYPGVADEITSFEPRETYSRPAATNQLDFERNRGKKLISDLIPLWTLYHRRSDAMPDGRYFEFLSGDIFLCDSTLPYEQVPLIPITPGEVVRSVHGDTPFHHLLGLQEVYDNLSSAVASNNIATALQLIAIPGTNQDYDFNEITDGLAVITWDSGPGGGKPEGISLAASNAHAIENMKLVKGDMEEISGINATIRGNPPASVTSGSFAALVAQQAITYAGQFQYSFQQAVAQTGNMIVSILKQYADQPIIAEIGGSNLGYQLQQFSRGDLNQIHRVTVKSGNPAARTPAARRAMADALLAQNLITKHEYMALIETGELDSVLEPQEAELINVQLENEMFRQGENPPVLAIDSHRLHIRHHKAALGDPASRANPKIVQAALAHIQEHANALKSVDPQLLEAIGETPMAVPQPTPPPALGGPPGSTPPPAPGGPAGATPAPSPIPAPNSPPEMPQQPSMPTNPATGQPWQPTDGGMQS
jgi:hypothetical protein